MVENNKIFPSDNGSYGAVETVPLPSRLPAWNLSPHEPHLYDYLLILRKHQWLILSFMLAVVTITSIGTFRMQPVYVALSRIEIDRENSNILPFPGADSYDYISDLDNYIETQSKILTSETMALQTIRGGVLSGQVDFASDPSSDAWSTGSLATLKPPPELASFLASLSVKRVPNSRLMDVSFESTNPLLAAQIVNAHIKNFIEQNFQSRYEATTRASTWLTDQLSELKIRVEKTEDARITYERQNQIWALDGDKQNVTTQRMSDLNKELTDVQSERMVQYSILKREAEANKALYDGLLTKLKEAGISAGLRSSNIRVVDPAMVPTTPARPAKTRNIVLSFLIGLVGGIGLALLREYMDNPIKSPDDIETLPRLPSLTVVHAVTEPNRDRSRVKLLKGASTNRHEKRIELLAQHLPKSQVSEAFRALRTALLLSQADHPPQVILVTSALPREGKTTAAANPAVTLAQLADRTLLIDADLLKPAVGRLLNLGSGKYAAHSSYLTGAS